MKRVFVSHHSAESLLANGFAKWLESLNPGRIQCFCSSRPHDIAPGAEWFREICSEASRADFCVILVSPFSAANSWLHFEAGLTYGAGIGRPQQTKRKWPLDWLSRFAIVPLSLANADERTQRIVPMVYGGMVMKHLPNNLTSFQCVNLQVAERLHAFVYSHDFAIERRTATDLFQSFTDSIGPVANRILLFGEPAASHTGAVITERFDVLRSLSLGGVTKVRIPRVTPAGQARAVRVKFVPRLNAYVPNWKFGVALSDGANTRYLQLHAGHHDALSTWTFYYLPPPSHNYIAVPARMAVDQEHELQLWISNDERAICVWRDSSKRIGTVTNEEGKNSWKISSNTWSEIHFDAWNDGHPFQVDIVHYEVDRTP